MLSAASLSVCCLRPWALQKWLIEMLFGVWTVDCGECAPVTNTEVVTGCYCWTVGVSAFERCMLTKMEELKQAVGDVRRSQALLAAKVDSLLQAGVGGQVSTDLPDDVDLPVTSVRALQALDHRLGAEQQLKQMMVSGHVK